MQPALDSTTMDRLISLGRERGHVTTEDLRASLPIDAMSAEDIALIVVHLEETGVPVELEEKLLAPAHAKPAPQRSAEIILFPGPRAGKRAAPKMHSLQGAKPALAEAGQGKAEGANPAHWIIAAAGLLAFAALLLVIFLTAG